MSKPTKSRTRQLSRAELKAYEARRAAEANRTVPDISSVVSPGPQRTVSTVRRPRALSRDEEFAIIRADLRRLLLILALLAAILVVLTFVLR